MFIASRQSRKNIVHTECCYQTRQIRTENEKFFYTWEEAQREGYRFCVCCNPVIRCYREEVQEILTFAQENGVSVCLRPEGAVDVKTPFSQWKIVPGGARQILLYHRNSFSIPGEKSAVPGYHEQKVLRGAILSYLQYIVEHDAYRQRNPLPARKKKPEEHHYRKGSKKYRKQQRRMKRQEHRAEVRRVYELIEALQA